MSLKRLKQTAMNNEYSIQKEDVIAPTSIKNSYGRCGIQPLPEKKVAVKTISPLALMKLAEELQREPDSLAYHQATNVAPDVVESESNPALFLRFPDAAQRLAKYWKYRTKWLPTSRAFQPIIGRKSQLVQIIPDDKEGHKVLLWRGNQPTQFNQAGLSCLVEQMTALAVSAFNDSVLPVEVVMILRGVALDQDVFEVLENAMPVRLHAIYLCSLQGEATVKVWEGHSSKVHQHFASKDTDFAGKLRPHGILAENLPVDLGGSLDSESKICIKSSPSNTSKKPAPSSSALKTLAEVAEGTQLRARKDRKRKLDAEYARRRRIREKHEEAHIREQFEDVSRENKKLRQENDRLEALLAETKEKVKFVEYGIAIASKKGEKKKKAKNSNSSKRKATRPPENVEVVKNEGKAKTDHQSPVMRKKVLPTPGRRPSITSDLQKTDRHSRVAPLKTAPSLECNGEPTSAILNSGLGLLVRCNQATDQNSSSKPTIQQLIQNIHHQGQTKQQKGDLNDLQRPNVVNGTNFFQPAKSSLTNMGSKGDPPVQHGNFSGLKQFPMENAPAPTGNGMQQNNEAGNDVAEMLLVNQLLDQIMQQQGQQINGNDAVQRNQFVSPQNMPISNQQQSTLALSLLNNLNTGNSTVNGAAVGRHQNESIDQASAVKALLSHLLSLRKDG